MHTYIITNCAMTLNLRMEVSFKRCLEGPKCLRVKFSRPDKNARNPQKFLSLGYAVATCNGNDEILGIACG